MCFLAAQRHILSMGDLSLSKHLLPASPPSPRQPTQPRVFTSKLAFYSNQPGRKRGTGGCASKRGPFVPSGMDIPAPGSALLKRHATKVPIVIFKGEFPYALPIHVLTFHVHTLSFLKPLPGLARLCLYRYGSNSLTNLFFSPKMSEMHCTRKPLKPWVVVTLCVYVCTRMWTPDADAKDLLQLLSALLLRQSPLLNLELACSPSLATHHTPGICLDLPVSASPVLDYRCMEIGLEFCMRSQFRFLCL